MNPEKKTALLMILVVATVFVLASVFLLPTTINVIVEGNDSIVTAIPGVYTLTDCIIIAIAAFLLGAVTIFLYQISAVSPHSRAAILLPSPPSVPEIENGVQDPGHDPVPEVSKDNSIPEGTGSLLNLLKGNEREVMEALVKYGEMNQADLSSRTGIPKSTLSRTLQNLEDRKLVHRYENGMSKMVKPEVDWNNFGDGHRQ
jgi:uncharacterized membrane protein